MATCIACSTSYQPKDWETKKSDYKCGPCRRRYNSDYRLKRKEMGRPVITGRTSPEREREYRAVYYKQEHVKIRRAERQRERHHSPEHAERIAARMIIRNALRRGEMTKLPCAKCGNPKSEGHHEDYLQPLVVTWLCRAHHVERHLDPACNPMRNVKFCHAENSARAKGETP